MLFTKLKRLQRHRSELLDLIQACKNADADPEIVYIRLTDLYCDLQEVERKIKYEEDVRVYIYIAWTFVGITALIFLKKILL